MFPALSRLSFIAVTSALLTLAGPVFSPGSAFSANSSAGEYLYLAANPVIDILLIPPSPAEGDIVLNDPPGFNWLPEEGSKGFVLEVSRDPLFRESAGLLEKADSMGSLIPA
ncbi:MAG: hypothetical protein U9N45_01850, partial [Gemmatimonadota bacterium]|nr:hypothetical protein [Gemmatimonadota bacterium]